MLTIAKGLTHRALEKQMTTDTTQQSFTLPAAPSASGGRRLRGFQPGKLSSQRDPFFSVPAIGPQDTFNEVNEKLFPNELSHDLRAKFDEKC